MLDRRRFRSAGGSRTVATVLLALAWSLFVPAIAPPARAGVGEYEVKAAFLYNFAKFTLWPAEIFASPTDPIVIVVLGEDPFGDCLERAVAGKTAQGRPLVVRRVRRWEQAVPSHIVFVCRSEEPRLGAIFGALRGMSMVMVGDTDGFAGAGGTIGLILKGRHVDFEINVVQASRSGVRFSSKLLSLAHIVGPRS